jgi:hypothetical protein
MVLEAKVKAAEEVGFGFGDLEGGVVIARFDEGGALLQAFARPLAEGRVFPGEGTRLKVGRADFELSADAGDQAFSLHAGLAEFEEKQAFFSAWRHRP